MRKLTIILLCVVGIAGCRSNGQIKESRDTLLKQEQVLKDKVDRLENEYGDLKLSAAIKNGYEIQYFLVLQVEFHVSGTSFDGGHYSDSGRTEFKVRVPREVYVTCSRGDMLKRYDDIKVTVKDKTYEVIELEEE